MSHATPRTRIERAMSLRNGKPIEQMQAGRACTYPGCATQLSRYNPNPTCVVHGGWTDDTTRRNRDIL